MRRDSWSILMDYVDRYSKGTSEYVGVRASKRSGRNWIPVRYCAEDWILAAWVYSFTRELFEIGLFLHADHTRFKKDSGLRAALGICLAEAYNQTGKMELTFIGRAGSKATLETGFEPTIPVEIVRLADGLGIGLDRASGRVPHREGAQIFLRLVGLSKGASDILRAHRVDLVQAGFVIQRSIWTKDQVEYLASECHDPAALFEGGRPPENRLLALRDLWPMRVAILSERFRAMIGTPSDSQGPVQHSWKGTTREVVSPESEVRLRDAFGRTIDFRSDAPVDVVYLPYDSRSIGRRFPSAHGPNKGACRCIVVPQDIDMMVDAERVCEEADRQKISVVRVVDSLAEIDFEIGRRLGQSVSTRRAIPERSDA